MIKITPGIFINPSEIKLSFTTSRGPGGQNVNKVATAVQLRFNVLHASTLSEEVRQRLIFLLKNKLTRQGEIIIKANRYRTQERNKQDALERLCQLIKKSAVPPKKRKKTKLTLAAKQKRLKTKKIIGEKKTLRRGIMGSSLET